MEGFEALHKNGGVTGTAFPVRDRTASKPICSVVIPTFNGRDLLDRCLASIARHRPVSPHLAIEVVVADDASTDGTADWLARAYPGVRLVTLEHNRGFCAAANAGIAAACGQFVQLLNNDTEVSAGWIEAALAPFADESVGSVAPLVLVRANPTRVDSAGDAYTLSGWPIKRGHGQPAAAFASRPVEEVFGASGSSAFYRAQALRRVGAFDPFLGSYYEDVDLAFRLRWAGYRCVFCPASVILHDVSATYDHKSPALQRLIARNAEIVFWSNLPTRLLAKALLPHIALLAVQSLWRLARGRLTPFLIGKCDALRARPEVMARRALRVELATTTHPRPPRVAGSLPHFALGTGSVQAVRNHLTRPRERSALRKRPR
jgi:GT2 family glycosyltransferase